MDCIKSDRWNNVHRSKLITRNIIILHQLNWNNFLATAWSRVLYVSANTINVCLMGMCINRFCHICSEWTYFFRSVSTKMTQTLNKQRNEMTTSRKYTQVTTNIFDNNIVMSHAIFMCTSSTVPCNLVTNYTLSAELWLFEQILTHLFLSIAFRAKIILHHWLYEMSK